MFKAKYQAHRLINYFFYLIVFIMGFLIGIGAKKLDFKNLIGKFLMIDNVYAATVTHYTVNSSTFTRPNSSNWYSEETIMGFFDKIIEVTGEDIDFNDYHYVIAYSNNRGVWTTSNNYHYEFCSNVFTESLSHPYISNATCYGITLNYYTPSFSLGKSVYDEPSYIYSDGIGSLRASNVSLSDRDYALDFSEYLVRLDAQVNTWNGYGYDFYTNQVGILDMRRDTYIIDSHTCPNDGEFASGYFGDTKDICFWSYNNNLSDFLVFYFNGRIYDSENIDWSDITFLNGHTYSLSFTLYGLVPQEQLYSIQFSHEGNLNQEIYSSSFGKVLVDSLDEKTYLTFSITPTEDITFDHFFLKYFTNGSYAQTIGASRLWVYNDYTGLSDTAIQIIQTDKILSQNQGLKDLIKDPYVNSTKVSSFWNDFDNEDFGLTSIVRMPLSLIQKISNGVCTPYNVTILSTTISMPCGNTIFWDREDVSTFKIFWNIFWGGSICYGIGISIYKMVHNFKDPDNDKVEVIDL